MKDKPTINPQGVSPLKHICMTIGELPTSYLETMTYYEMLVWFTKFLQEKMIPALDNNALAVEELQHLFLELQSYVNNYFDNLDVQDEINNKLDEMAESGQLTDIIAQYLGLAGMITFNTVSEMKNATNLVNGSKCETLGYYSVNDGGGATYKIREITNEDVVDESTIIALYDNTLIAELILEDIMILEQFGCYGDGSHDDTTKFQIALNKQINLELKNGSNYLLTSNLDLPRYVHIEGNKGTIKYEYDGTREHQIRNSNWLNNNNELNTLYLNNVNFYVNSTNRQIKLIGLTDYENIIITNCNYSNNLSLTSGSWFFDLYSNCSNVLIDNINVETLTTNEQLMNTCIGIREYRNTKTTNNIKILNSKFIHNGKDETVWMDSWLGTIENVYIDNCLIHDKSSTATTMSWIGNNDDYSNSYFNNCLINNCILIKDKVDTTGFKFGYQGDTNAENCKNFIMNNCIIQVKDGSGSIISGSIHSKESTIKNCKIIVEDDVDDYSYGFISRGNFKFENCDINVKHSFSNQSTAFWNISDGIYNCNIKLNGGRVFNQLISKIINTTITGAYILFNAQNITNDINLDIINCNIEVSNQLISRIGITTNSNILIKDCNIKQSSESILHLYSVTGTKNTRIINTNFENTTLVLTDSQNEVLTISNCTLQGKPLSGIPASPTRGACVIGTIFDGGTGHAVVRKITDGNETTNWEEI